MNTLYLHIGTPKTATSTIQHFLEGNRQALLKNGYCYMDTVCHFDGVKDNRNAHFLINVIYDENGMRNNEEEDRITRKGLDMLAECFSHSPNVILSDEGIWWRVAADKRNVLGTIKQHAEKEGYQVKIIVYLRRQDTFFVSHWNQRIKRGNSTEDWDTYLKKAMECPPVYLDYLHTLDSISSLFGKENVIVRRFEPEHFYHGSIIEDFLQTAGLSLTEDFIIEEPVVNTGIAGNATELKRILNRIPGISLTEELLFIEALKRSSKTAMDIHPCSMFSPEENKAFLDYYAEDNKKLAQKYFGTEEPLFHNEIRPLPKWEAKNMYVFEDAVGFAGELALSLFRENMKLDGKIKQLKLQLLKQKQQTRQMKKELELIQKQLDKLSSSLDTTKNKLAHPVKTVSQKIYNSLKG